jgi:hypothetical protein
VGRRVASLPVGEPVALGLSLADAEQLRRDARSGSTLPALVSGLSSRPAVVAVVLNGVVAGVSPTSPFGSGHLFATMVPDALIRSTNTVALYEVTGLPGSPVLHPRRGGSGAGGG